MNRSWRTLSGDSTAREIAFADGCVTCLYDDYDSDQTFALAINTDVALIQNGNLAHPVHPRLDFGDDILDVDNESGIYISSADFANQMKHAKSAMHLLYGRKSTDWIGVFQLIGYGIHLDCPVCSEDAIMIRDVSG